MSLHYNSRLRYAEEVSNCAARYAWESVSILQATFHLIQGLEHQCISLMDFCKINAVNLRLHGLLQLMAMKSSARFVAAAPGP